MGCLGLSRTKSKALASSSKIRKVVMIGLDGAGKTTITYKMKLGETQQTTTTIGLNVETIKHRNTEFLVFDIGGSARSLWVHYLQDVDVLIWVIDSSEKERLPIIREEIAKVAQMMKNQDFLLAIFLNKQDLPSKLPTHEILQKIGVDEIDVSHMLIQTCSAVSGDGLKDGLEKIVDCLLQKEKMKNNPMLSLKQVECKETCLDGEKMISGLA